MTDKSDARNRESTPRHDDVASAYRAFEANKARIEAGTTFRSQSRTGWRRGASPGRFDRGNLR